MEKCKNCIHLNKQATKLAIAVVKLANRCQRLENELENVDRALPPWMGTYPSRTEAIRDICKNQIP